MQTGKGHEPVVLIAARGIVRVMLGICVRHGKLHDGFQLAEVTDDNSRLVGRNAFGLPVLGILGAEEDWTRVEPVASHLGVE